MKAGLIYTNHASCDASAFLHSRSLIICAWLGLRAASCFIRLTFTEVLVLHSHRLSNKGIVDVFAFFKTPLAAINASGVDMVEGG